MHPNHIYYQRHPEFIQYRPNESAVFCSCQSIGQYVFVNEVCKLTGLNMILKNVYNENIKK